MNSLNRILMVAVASAFLTSSAMAFQGLSFGVIAHDATFETKGKEEEGLGMNTDSIQEIHTATHIHDVDFGALFVEYSGGEASSVGLTIGLEHIPGDAVMGTKSRTDTVSDANETSDDSGTYTAKAEVSDHTMLYIEPTYMFGETLGIYGKGGVARMTVTSLESISKGEDSSAYGNEEVWGGMYGFGAKIVSPWGLFLKVEQTTTVYESFSLKSKTGNKNKITAQPEAESVKIAIGYNF